MNFVDSNQQFLLNFVDSNQQFSLNFVGCNQQNVQLCGIISLI